MLEHLLVMELNIHCCCIFRMLLTFNILLFILIHLLAWLLLGQFFLIFHMLLCLSFPFFLIRRLQFFIFLSFIWNINGSRDVLIIRTLLLFYFKGRAWSSRANNFLNLLFHLFVITQSNILSLFVGVSARHSILVSLLSLLLYQIVAPLLKFFLFPELLLKQRFVHEVVIFFEDYIWFRQNGIMFEVWILNIGFLQLLIILNVLLFKLFKVHFQGPAELYGYLLLLLEYDFVILHIFFSVSF